MFLPQKAHIVIPRVLSRDFYKLHHYHVFSQSGVLLGMFASLYCAAQTALHTPKERYVIDTENKRRHGRYELAMLGLADLVPIKFDYSLARVEAVRKYVELADCDDEDYVDPMTAVYER